MHDFLVPKSLVLNLIDLNFEYVLQISSYFTGKLLSIVRDAIHHMKKMNNDQHNSPGVMQTAATIHKVDAPLEFIKHVCAAFALDQNVQHDVLVVLAHHLHIDTTS